MNPNVAQTSTKKIAKSASSLEPSAIVTLFEIDLSTLIARGERTVISNISEPVNSELRFHNNLKLIQNDIIWGGTTYYPAPIKAEGFETTAKGSPPTPKLTITVNPEGLDEETALRVKYIKYAIRDLDSLVGAKVTRTRTFARYIDGANFYDNYGTNNQKLKSNILPPPEGFDPDPLEPQGSGSAAADQLQGASLQDEGKRFKRWELNRSRCTRSKEKRCPLSTSSR